MKTVKRGGMGKHGGLAGLAGLCDKFPNQSRKRSLAISGVDSIFWLMGYIH
jgi:hypothetical protein